MIRRMVRYDADYELFILSNAGNPLVCLRKVELGERKFELNKSGLKPFSAEENTIRWNFCENDNYISWIDHKILCIKAMGQVAKNTEQLRWPEQPYFWLKT